MTTMKPNWLKVFFSLVILTMAAPSICLGSDMTGALVFGLGLFLVLLALIGFGVAAVMRFAFKRSNKVWPLVLALPASAVVCIFAYFTFQPQPKFYQKGPDFESHGGHTTDVSPEFGEADLTRLYAKIESPKFKFELAKHTQEPLSNYIFAVTLNVPVEREARHYVTLYVHPEVTNRVTDDAMIDLFKWVVLYGDYPLGTNSTP